MSRPLLNPFRWLLASLCLLAASASAKDAVEYEIDPVHTRVMFAVEHAGFSHAIGTVSGSTGTLVFDPQNWAQARLDVSVPLERIDLGDGKWNRAALAGNLLDAEHYPQARFVSTRIEPQGENHAFVHGDLTLHGVTREVRLDVRLNALKRHPLPPFRRTAGFSATTDISRADFGITAWKSVIGGRIELRIEAEATRSGKADADESSAAPIESGKPAVDDADVNDADKTHVDDVDNDTNTFSVPAVTESTP